MDARAVFEPITSDSASMTEALGHLGAIAAREGDRVRALGFSQELAQLRLPYLRGAHTRWRARIAALLGDRDEAVQLLGRAFSEGVSYDLWIHTDMDLEPLRGYAPFEEMVRPKG